MPISPLTFPLRSIALSLCIFSFLFFPPMACAFRFRELLCFRCPLSKLPSMPRQFFIIIAVLAYSTYLMSRFAACFSSSDLSKTFVIRLSPSIIMLIFKNFPLSLSLISPPSPFRFLFHLSPLVSFLFPLLFLRFFFSFFLFVLLHPYLTDPYPAIIPFASLPSYLYSVILSIPVWLTVSSPYSL